jgi:rRNA processing protein Krr1/Pno1
MTQTADVAQRMHHAYIIIYDNKINLIGISAIIIIMQESIDSMNFMHAYIQRLTALELHVFMYQTLHVSQKVLCTFPLVSILFLQIQHG